MFKKLQFHGKLKKLKDLSMDQTYLVQNIQATISEIHCIINTNMKLFFFNTKEYSAAHFLWHIAHKYSLSVL